MLEPHAYENPVSPQSLAVGHIRCACASFNVVLVNLSPLTRPLCQAQRPEPSRSHVLDTLISTYQPHRPATSPSQHSVRLLPDPSALPVPPTHAQHAHVYRTYLPSVVRRPPIRTICLFSPDRSLFSPDTVDPTYSTHLPAAFVRTSVQPAVA
ncbi:hypothetical protein C8Q80DRAFT_726911 [Daedaleopsis nitida]|nr:hypothetical protein C8Q80DRAFT_726911 [Daedaleopsis nitida]